MPGNMDDLFDLDSGTDLDLSEREERCQKAIKTLTKAIGMRLFIVVLLVWVVVRTRMDVWVIGLMLLVMVINITGILPLAAELKKFRAEWKRLLEEE